MKQSYEVAVWFCAPGEQFPGGYVAPDYVGQIAAHTELQAAMLFMHGLNLAVPVVYVAVGAVQRPGQQVGGDSGDRSAVLRFESDAIAAHGGK